MTSPTPAWAKIRQGRQQLRQDERPADRLQQPAAFGERRPHRRLRQPQAQAQREQRARLSEMSAACWPRSTGRSQNALSPTAGSATAVAGINSAGHNRRCRRRSSCAVRSAGELPGAPDDRPTCFAAASTTIARTGSRHHGRIACQKKGDGQQARTAQSPSASGAPRPQRCGRHQQDDATMT